MAGKTGNILALYDVLYRCTDEDHPLTMREIQDEMVEMGYNCSEDTILRHIRLLREWHVEVEGSMGRNARYYLGNRLLKKEELKLIVDAINASNFIGREIADEMVQKLKKLLSENQCDYLDCNVLGMVKVREICPNTYVSRRMGMFTGDERKITVAASEEMVGPIIDQFGKNIKVCANPDKTDKSNELLIEFYAVPSIILLGWLVGLGEIEVIGPKEVKEDMIDLLKKTSARYDRQ